jgi:hypothetical protein
MEYVFVVIAIFGLIFLVSLIASDIRPEKRQTAKPDKVTSKERVESKDLKNPNDEIVSIVGPLDDAASVRRTYVSVFALLTSERRTNLIRYYEAKHRCGEIEAMKFAIMDRQNDEERYC